MAEKKTFKQNTFCWVELESTDVEAAKTFYAPLFGWEFQPKTTAGAEPYWVAMKGGDHAAGLFRGKSSHWTSNIAVESVDAILTKAKSLGAAVKEEAKDWGEFGRSAVLLDPTGAEVALWQAREPHTAERNKEGSFCWTELLTPDAAKAEKFYTSLFGWQAKRAPDMPDYVMFNLGDTMVAGMMQITKEMAGAPPQWMVYFTVADCDAVTKSASRARAEVIVPPKDIPNVGRFSVITDPSGATFSVIKLAPAQTQAKSA
ncbi:MAG: VOC family protein [Bdellovibrionota bacterium]